MDGSPGAPAVNSAFTSISTRTDRSALVEYAPKKSGELGEKIKISANFFKIHLDQRMPDYHCYTIKLLRDDCSVLGGTGREEMKIELRNQIFAVLLEQYRSTFNCSLPPVFDGKKSIYSIEKLAIPNNWSNKVTIENKVFTVVIRKAEILSDMKRLNRKESQMKPNELQALDTIIRNGLKLCKSDSSHEMHLNSFANFFRNSKSQIDCRLT